MNFLSELIFTISVECFFFFFMDSSSVNCMPGKSCRMLAVVRMYFCSVIHS